MPRKARVYFHIIRLHFLRIYLPDFRKGKGLIDSGRIHRNCRERMGNTYTEQIQIFGEMESIKLSVIKNLAITF